MRTGPGATEAPAVLAQGQVCGGAACPPGAPSWLGAFGSSGGRTSGGSAHGTRKCTEQRHELVLLPRAGGAAGGGHRENAAPLGGGPRDRDRSVRERTQASGLHETSAASRVMHAGPVHDSEPLGLNGKGHPRSQNHTLSSGGADGARSQHLCAVQAAGLREAPASSNLLGWAARETVSPGGLFSLLSARPARRRASVQHKR